MVRLVEVGLEKLIVVLIKFVLLVSFSGGLMAQTSKDRLERSEQVERIKDELAEERLIEENIIEEDIVDEDEIERKRWDDAWERREQQRDQVEDDLQRDRDVRRRYRY